MKAIQWAGLAVLVLLAVVGLYYLYTLYHGYRCLPLTTTDCPGGKPHHLVYVDDEELDMLAKIAKHTGKPCHGIRSYPKRQHADMSTLTEALGRASMDYEQLKTGDRIEVPNQHLVAWEQTGKKWGVVVQVLHEQDEVEAAVAEYTLDDYDDDLPAVLVEYEDGEFGVVQADLIKNKRTKPLPASELADALAQLSWS